MADDGAIDRSQFNDEMADPNVRNSLAAITHREVGDQGPEAQQAFVESVFNRATSRGTSVAQAISGQDGYYPRKSLLGSDGIPQRNLGTLDGIISNVHTQGTNLSNGATGNASGTVGFDGGPQTFSAGGDLIRFAVQPLTIKILWMWIAGGLIEFAIVGALVGAIYKPRAVP